MTDVNGGDFGGVEHVTSRNGIVVGVSPITPTTVRRNTVGIRVRPCEETEALLLAAVDLVRAGKTVHFTAYAPDAPHDPGRLKVGTVPGYGEQQLPATDPVAEAVARHLSALAELPLEDLWDTDNVPGWLATLEDLQHRLGDGRAIIPRRTVG